jgi:hypothetical protein
MMYTTFMAEATDNRNDTLRNAALIGGVAALPTAGLLASRGLLKAAPTALVETAANAAGNAVNIPLAAAATTAGATLASGLLKAWPGRLSDLGDFKVMPDIPTFLDQPILST